MNNDIQVKYFDKEIKCPYETAADSILALFGIYEKTVVAIRINNEICPLKTKIALDSSIEPVFLDSPEGAMLYRRSLAFLLAVAAQKLYPNRILSIGHSLGNSYYYTFHSGKPPTEKEVSALGEVMESIVLENLPIEFKYLSYQQAMDMFAKNRQEDTVSLLYQRCTARVKVNECKGFADIFFEPLAPSTGLLSSFRLMPYQ
ncbi:MAG: nucleoside kinase, partial [Treponema sp.]|nr:nucleoside kinase [Treponema sp.]